jgi:hypothetical protein
MVVDNQLIRFYELIKLNKTQEAEIEIVKLLSSLGLVHIIKFPPHYAPKSQNSA